MAWYGFEYFCGANVIVSVNSMPILEAAGISYQAQDSKMPIYGYSSRHYDAVASGQVIISGTLLVNYVHQDYLFRAIELGSGGAAEEQVGTVQGPSGTSANLSAIAGDYEQAAAFVQAMKAQYWNSGLAESTFSNIVDSFNPFDVSGGVDLTIAFGEQNGARPYGRTATLLVDVHFTGRSTAIRIDEDVIVEAHEFFARDVFSLRNRLPGLPVDPEDPDSAVSLR